MAIGIPDESGSHSTWLGTAKAPDAIRKVSNARDVYIEKNFQCPALPAKGLPEIRVHDYGNIKKRQIPQVFEKILAFPKIPISIGGDHSNTTPILKALSKKYGKISLVYFDAHPDFVSHTRNYYGSVITDSLDYIDVKSSLQIGIRSPEAEELVNLKKHGLRAISPLDVVENGIREVSKIIKDTTKGNVYVSFDMDCLDPAYAPGVSVPVPIGLESQDCTYLLKGIASRGLIGMDIMEVCPAHDLNDVTSHLASRIIGEVVSSCKV
ncbi:arginase family protein [Candidatus Nitrosotenuis cloacae]|uniref:arginase family protein n=1 Tax=Candidatus Nitrosotenuis cloacae TaxID=1603555 RepID=UPI0022816AD0|nr:arginase family protein [Candidatus Nitrosotenuis cloacae]